MSFFTFTVSVLASMAVSVGLVLHHECQGPWACEFQLWPPTIHYRYIGPNLPSFAHPPREYRT